MKDVVFGGRMLLSVLLAVVAQAALAEKTNTEPIYTITVPGTFSNTFETITGDLPEGVTFKRTADGVTTDCTYGDFIDEKEAGTLVKDGEGWLVIDRALSNWSGQIHIDKGVVHVCVAEGGLGKVLCSSGLPADGDATYVAKGATLLMDSSGMDIKQRAERKKIVFEGDGAEGMKGAFIVYQKGNVTGGTSGNQSWWFGTLPTLSGDATLASDTSKMRAMLFNDPSPTVMDLGGHTLRIVKGGAGSVDFNQNNALVTNGQIVADNVKYHMQNGSVAFAAGAESSLTLTNGAYLSLEGAIKVPGPANWTLNVDCPSYVQYMGNAGGYGIAVTNAYGWYGPVVLNNSFGIETGANGYGGTFGGVVSGPGGFYSKGGQSPFLLHLLNPKNTFTGGVKLSDMSLALYADGALPAQGGSLALTNGCLYLASLLSDYDDDKGRTCSRYQTSYTLPGANFDGTGVVRVVSGKTNDYARVLTPGSPGRWTDPVVKTGAGELDYDASMGGDELDIRQGGVKLHFAGAGLIKSRVRYPDDAADAVVKAFHDSSEILTNEVTLTPDMAYGRGAAGGWTQRSAGVYEGWIWNREATNVNWTFAAAVNNGVKVFFDGTSIISVGNNGAKKTVEAAPGPHHLVLRMYTTCNVGPVIADYPKGACSKSWPANVGFLWDPLGRGSEDGKNDYIRLEDPGDGSLLTVSADGSALDGLVPQFTNITICAGAYLDLNGNGTCEVEKLVVSGGEIRNSNALFTNLTVKVGESLELGGTPAEGGALLSIAGGLQLGGGADVTVDTTDLPKEDFTLVSAVDGIAGFPDEIKFTGERAGRYGVRPSADGKSMTCVYTAPGTVIIFR